jgi:hypothetical protein
MTNLIDDETASRYWRERDTAPEAERESRNTALMDWAKAKKSEQRRTQRDEVEGGYTDFEGWWKTTGATAAMFNGDEDRQEILNRRYIAHHFDQSPDEQGRFYPTYRDQFTQQVFGKSGLSEAETFNLIKGAVESRKATESAIRELPGVLAKGVLRRAAEGKKFDEVDSWFAFSGWKERHADKIAGLPEDWESAMMDSAVKLHTRTEALIADMAPESKRAMDVLMKFTRPEDAADLPEAGRAEVENLAKEFAKLTPEQRDGIYATLYYAAEADGAGQGKWFFEKVAQGLGRGGANIYDDATITAQDRVARQNISYFQELLNKPQAEPDRMQTADSIQMQRDLAQRGLEENEQRLKELRVMREIRDIAQGVIDPIKTEMDGLAGMIAQGAYDFSQSAAYTGMAMIPYVGLPAVMGALANSNYLRMIDEYPDMDADAAWTLSMSIAAPQAVVERFQANALIGRSPMLNSLMRRMTDVRLPLPVRLGIGYGANVAFQTAQEFVQEAMPVITDQIAAAIREDMPEFDAEKAWGAYAKQMPDIFFSMLWAGLIGSGTMTFRELKRNGQFERSLEELEMVGITGKTAEDIAAEQDPDAATAKFREAWNNRKPEDIQAGIRKRAAQLDAAREQQPDLEIPARRVVENPDGTFTHIIEKADGTPIYRTSDPVAADMALVNITRMMQRGRITDTTTGIVESLQFIDQVNQALARGEDVQQLVIDGAPRTLLDEYEANPTQDNLDNLFATVRAFGQEINEPAELAQYPVLASNRGALAEGIYKSVIRIQDGATGVEVMRDFSQDNLKRALAEQRITMDWVREQLNQVIPLIESDRLEGRRLRTETDTDVIESFSDVAVAYMTGRIRDEQVPAGLRGFLRRIAIVVKDIFRRAYNLARLRAEGKLDQDFEALLAESVGLDQQAIVDTTRERVGNEVLTDTNSSIGKGSADRAAVSDFLNQVRTQSRGKKPISIEIGKLEGAVLENLPEPFRELAGYPIKIDEDLIRKNDNLSKQTQSLQQLRIQIPTDEDYYLLSEFINSANRITQGDKRNDGTSTIEFRNSSDPKVAVTAIRNKAGYLAVVRFVGEEAALPLTEPNEGRQELTPEAAGQDQPATSDGNVNFSIAVPANFISQVSDKDDQFRVGTAKLGTAKVPKDTPQESNISGTLVPDDLLGKQMEKINYAHLPKNILSEKDPKKKRRKLINWFKKNLLALHDAFPEEFRARATHWYDGANRIARELGGKFQASVEQASGVIAVFSPQKDWFMNVAQAEQFMDLWANSQDVVLQESLVRAEIEGIIEAATVADKQKRKKTPGETKEQTAERREYNKALDKLEKEKRRKIVEQVIGKTIRELDSEPDLQGWAIRVLAQVTFGRNYRNLSPEGDRLGMATNDDGALAKNGWGSNSEIKKAVRIMKDGSLKNISENLGNEHKVRNFFNNIVAPNSPFGDATIDTHAVAAAHLMPYGAKAVEVGHNFGANMNSSEVLGISGIYHLYLDAYREAAAERGLQPRQMQSITWEAIRLVYPAANKNAAALAKAEKTWQVLTDANARNSLVGGRTPSPVWAGANDNRESQGVAGGLQKARGRNVSGRGLLSGVRPAGAGRDGVADFSIATPRDIQRVSKAFDAAARSPDERIATFERAKSRFFSVLSANQQALDDLRSGTISFRRTQLLQALGELDAILSVFPPDIRGRVGGYTKLASIAPHDVFKDGKKISEVSGMKGAIISAWMKEGQNIGQAGKQTALPPGYTAKENLSTARADRAIAEFFKNRIEVLDRELEKTLRREYDEAFQKLLDRTKPKKAKPGEKPKGIGADVQDLFAVVREAVNMSATDVAAHIAGLDAKIASGELTAEQEARAQVEAALVSLVGDWKNASADRRKSAFMEASRIWNGAYAAHAQKVIALRQQREVARLNAVVATGKAGDMSGRKAKAIRDSGLKGTWKDFFLNLLNFDQVAGVLFGENSEVANTMIDAQRIAENAKEDGSQAKMQELEDFFTQLAGGNLLDGEKLRYDLAQPSMTVQGIRLSQLEGLSAVMMWAQEDGRRHMEGELDETGNPVGAWHYNQAFIDEILNNLSDEALALRSWLLRRYADEYAKINEVYSELNGVNLPQIQFYSPITVQPLSAPTGQVLDPVSGSAMSGASTSPGALRTRGTAIAEPRFQDALQTYISHTLQMEHWKAFAPFVAEANAVLRNRDVQNSVEEKGGAEARKVLNAWLDYFAQGGTRDAGAHLALNQGLSNVLGRGQQVALIGRISTLLIQSTQLGAALAEMPLKAYLKRMGQLLTGRLGFTEALKSDYIQRRIDQMPPVVQMAMQGLKGAKPTAIQQAGKKLGMLLSGADGFFTAGTYAITYDYQLSKAKELGLTGQEAETYARNIAERVTDRIAQPTRPGARSLYENTATNPLARAGWAFASEARKNLAIVAYSFAQRDIKTQMRTLAYVVAINSIMAAILRSIWRDIMDDEDDELFDDKYWSPKRIAIAVATEPFYGFPVLGSVVQEAVYKSFGEYKPAGSLFSVDRAVGPIKRLPEYLSGDFEMREVMRDIDMLMSALGLMHPNLAAASSITHLARDLFNVGDSVVDAVTED